MRGLPADETGITALRHDFRVRPVAERDDARNLFNTARPHHAERAAAIEAAVLDEVALHVGGIVDDMARADDLTEARQERGFIQHAGILGDRPPSPKPGLPGAARHRAETNLALG